MKIKKLISELQQIADKYGEDLYVCCGNCDVADVTIMPAYYDGPQQIVTTDSEGHAISGRYNRAGDKVDLYLWRFSEMIFDRYKTFEIDYSGLHPARAAEYKANHDKIREEAKNLDYKLDLEYFTKHIKERAEKIMEDDEHDLDRICKTFFDEHYKERNIPSYVPIQKEKDWYMSYVDRKNAQWDMEVEISYTGYGFELKKKEIPPTTVENNVV